MGIPQKYGYLLGGSLNEDYSSLGSILGSPHFGKLPYEPPCWVVEPNKFMFF